jgi:hypothetical protein
MQPIIFTFDGMSDLLVNNPQTADRLNPWSQLIAELTGKKKRTDDEERQLQRLKWEASPVPRPQARAVLAGHRGLEGPGRGRAPEPQRQAG